MYKYYKYLFLFLLFFNIYSFIKENIITIGRLFKTWRIDKALIAFLQCLKQFGEYLENNNDSDKVFQLSYR